MHNKGLSDHEAIPVYAYFMYNTKYVLIDCYKNARNAQYKLVLASHSIVDLNNKNGIPRMSFSKKLNKMVFLRTKIIK